MQVSLVIPRDEGGGGGLMDWLSECGEVIIGMMLISIEMMLFVFISSIQV